MLHAKRVFRWGEKLCRCTSEAEESFQSRPAVTTDLPARFDHHLDFRVDGVDRTNASAVDRSDRQSFA